MTEAERIEKDAKVYVNSIPRIRKRMNLFSGYIAGATAENERLQQQLKDAGQGLIDLAKASSEKLKEKDEIIKGLSTGKEFYATFKYNDEQFTPYQIALQKLKSAQELNRELSGKVEFWKQQDQGKLIRIAELEKKLKRFLDE